MDSYAKCKVAIQPVDPMIKVDGGVYRRSRRWRTFSGCPPTRQYRIIAVLFVWTLFTAFFFGFADRLNTSTQLVYCDASGTVHVEGFDPDPYWLGYNYSAESYEDYEGFDASDYTYFDPYYSTQVGSSHPTNRTWNDLWASSSWFSTNLGFGSMTFAEAKIVDVCWDLLVGRGGQVVLIAAAYPMMREYMQLTTRSGSTFFDAYCGFAFRPCSFESITLMARHFQPRVGLVVFSRAVGVTILSVYIGLLPTLLSAMTSYQAKVQSYTPSDSGLILSSDFKPLKGLVIENGGAIGLNDNYPVPSGSSLWRTVSEYNATFMNAMTDVFSNSGLNFLYDNATRTYGKTYTCQPSTLCNITVSESRDHYLSDNDTLEALNWTTAIFLTGELRETAELLSVWDPGYAFYYQNTTYSPSTMLKESVCPPGRYYQWGFASLFLFAFCIVTESVILVALVMSIDLERWYPEGRERNYTLLGDIVDIAAALQRLVLEKGETSDELSDDDLADLTKRHPMLIIHGNAQLELTKRPKGVRKRTVLIRAHRRGRGLVRNGLSWTFKRWGRVAQEQNDDFTDGRRDETDVVSVTTQEAKQAQHTQTPSQRYEGT